MSLTVKHLNPDSSFLLTFRPVLPFPPSPTQSPNDFTVLLDPWLSGPSKIFHSKFSITRQKGESCVSTLAELAEPDLVVISQDKSDHCHKATLTQLPRSGEKTTILAEPAAAKLIKGWKYFDAQKVVTLARWGDPRKKNSTVHRIPIPPLSPDGQPGEVTIAFITQRPDLTGLHNAIGITYRPPSLGQGFERSPFTPPDTPRSIHSTFPNKTIPRTMSVIYSPHGCNYKTLAPYVTSHLVAEAALPLTALLHCFDRIQNAWYLGGNICSGFPGGLDIAQNLCARAWIGAHDGEKDVQGIATKKIKIEKYEREDVEDIVSPRSEKFPDQRTGTEVVVLQSGEEIQLTQGMDFGSGDDDSDHEGFVNMGTVC